MAVELGKTQSCQQPPGDVCSFCVRTANDLREYRQHTAANHRELFTRLTTVEKTLVTLTEQHAMIVDSLKSLKQSNEAIDRLIQHGRGAAWVITGIIGFAMIIPNLLDLLDRLRK